MSYSPLEEDVQPPTLIENFSPRQLAGISCVCTFAVVAMLFSVFLYGGGVEHHLMSWGPQPDFFILSMCIDTWLKYFSVVLMMVTAIMLKTFSKQVGWGICKFLVFDQSRRHVYGFHRGELIFVTEWLRTGENIIDMFSMVLLFAIYKFDIIIISIVIGALISLTVVSYLLRKKTFHPYLTEPPKANNQ